MTTLSLADHAAVVGLIDDASRLASAAYRRHAAAYRARGLDRDDVLSEARWGLIEACGADARDWRSYALSTAYRATLRLLRGRPVVTLAFDPPDDDPDDDPPPAWDALVEPLDDDDRTILRLAYVDDLPVRQIAARRACSHATAARSLERARDRVRTHLARA